jgi:hypothetical protein
MLILKFPDMDKEFLVCTNASKDGLGRLLMNYATHNLELLAIVYALRVWRHYLIG